MTKRQKEVLERFKQGAVARMVVDHTGRKVYYVLTQEGHNNESVQPRTIEALKAAKLIKRDEPDFMKVVLA